MSDGLNFSPASIHRSPSHRRRRHRRGHPGLPLFELIEISRQIVGISGHIELIATSTSEQSLSLQEINSTVNEMDQMTQRNAAMVEETNAAMRQLSVEADLLMELVGRFELTADLGEQRSWAAKPNRSFVA